MVDNLRTPHSWQYLAPTPEILEAPSAPVSTSKADNLESRRSGKMDRLFSRTGLGEYDLTNSLAVIDGHTEHMGNKIINDYSQAELQYLSDRLYEEQGVISTDSGLMRQTEGGLVPYTGSPNDLASLYKYGTKDGNSKLGTWGGLNPDDRYSEEYLQRASEASGRPQVIGEAGVDVNQLQDHRIMPRNTVNLVEALYHGNVNNLQNRVVRQAEDGSGNYWAEASRYGTGATEVYRPYEIANEEFDKEAVWQAFQNKYLPNRPANNPTERPRRDWTRAQWDAYWDGAFTDSAEDSYDPLQPHSYANRAINSVKAVGATLYKSLLLDSADAAVEGAGWLFNKDWDLMTAEEKSRHANTLFGYDDQYSRRAMELIGKDVGDIYKSIQAGESIDFSTAWRILSTGVRNPEILAEVTAYTLGLAVGFGKFTAVGKAVNGVQAQVRAGNMTRAAAKAEIKDIKSAHSIMQNATYLAGKGAGFTAMTTGMYNENIKEFAENNNGEYGALDIARVAALTTSTMYLERLAARVSLGDVPGLRNALHPMRTRALKKVVDELPPTMFNRIAPILKTSAVGVSKVAGAAGAEGATEYLQTVGELFATRWHSDKYGSSVSDLFFDDKTQIEAWTGAAIGAVAGGQMKTGGLVLGGAADLIPNSRKSLKKNIKEGRAKLPDGVSEEQAVADVGVYSQLATELGKITAGGINPENIHASVTILDMMEGYEYAAEAADPKRARRIKDQAEILKKQIVDMVLNDEDGSLDITPIASATTPVQPIEPNSSEDVVRARYSIPAGVEASVVPPQSLANMPDDARIVLTPDGTLVQTPYIIEGAIPLARYTHEGTSILNADTQGTVINSIQGRVLFAFAGDRELRVDGATANPTQVIEQSKDIPRPMRELNEEEQAIDRARVSAWLAATTEDIVSDAVEHYGSTLTPEQDSKLKNFAGKNGISEEAYESLKQQAEERATSETVPAGTYNTKLRRLVASGEANKKSTQRLYNTVLGRHTAIATGVRELQQGIEKARSKAAELNHREEAVPHSTGTMHTIFDTGVALRDGRKVTVRIHKTDSGWVAETGRAEELLARTVKAEQDTHNTLQDIATLPESIRPERVIDLGTMVVEGANATNSRRYTRKESSYVKRVVSSLNKVLPAGTTAGRVNKIILGETRSRGWESSGRKAQRNISITNTGRYHSSDVVYLDTRGTRTAKGQPVTGLRVKNSPARLELDKAMEAGATIIVSDGSKGALVDDFITSRTPKYVPLSVVGATNSALRNTYVPANSTVALADGSTATAQAFYEAEQLSVPQIRKHRKAKSKALADVALATNRLRAAELQNTPEGELGDLREDLAMAREEAAEYFTEAEVQAAREHRNEVLDSAQVQEQEGADDIFIPNTPLLQGITAVVLAGTETSVEARLDAYITDRTRRDIEAAKAEVLAGNDADIDPALLVLAETELQEARTENEKIRTLMSAWDQANSEGLTGKALRDVVNEALEPLGLTLHKGKGKKTGDTITLKEVSEMVLKSAAASGVKKRMFSTVVNAGGRTRFLPATATADFVDGMSFKRVTVEGRSLWELVFPTDVDGAAYDPYTDAQKTKALKRANRAGTQNALGGAYFFDVVQTNEFTLNPTDLVQVSEGTLLATVPVNRLPDIFQEVTNDTLASLRRVLPAFSADEGSFARGANSANASRGAWAAINSPARTFLFDKDGTVQPQVAAAMALALRDFVYTSKRQLLPGAKSDSEIVSMLDLDSIMDVTDDHRAFAQDSGLFLKSVADSLGRSVFAQLGFSRRSDTERARGEYERLISDIGNMLIQVALDQGALTIRDYASSDLAALTGSAEVRDGTAREEKVWMVTMPSQLKGYRSVPAGSVDVLLEQRAAIDELVPNAARTKKRPFYGKAPGEKYIQEMTESVRNDMVGAQIPEMAQKTLKGLTNNEYSLDLDVIGHFVDDILTDEVLYEGVLRHLKYIPIPEEGEQGTLEWEQLTYEQKQVQEAINDTALNAIENLVEAYNHVLNKVPDRSDRTALEEANSLFFGYYYSSAQRYSMDSTTLNPIANKLLHRFLVQPKSSTVTHKIDKEAGTLEVVVQELQDDGTRKPKSMDTSLFIRGALAQAFGVGVDKAATMDIIAVGNALLGLDTEQLASIENTLLLEGEAGIMLADGSEYVLEIKHLGHALQALDFLNKWATNTTGELEHGLTLELDALTSGFANKVHQMGQMLNLNNYNDIAARVGLFRKITNTANLDYSSYFAEDSELGVNDFLASGTVRDSYQNAAVSMLKTMAIQGAHWGVIDPENQPTASFYAGVKAMVPGLLEVEQLVRENATASKLNMALEKFSVPSRLRDLLKTPFMIFNYSAGVGRIAANTSNEVVTGILEAIAVESDWEVDSPVMQAASTILEHVKVPAEVASRPVLEQAQWLQTEIRTKPAGSFVLKKPITYSKPPVREGGKPVKTTYTKLLPFMVEGVFANSLGEALKSSFEAEYSGFRVIQDVTTDMFRSAFYVYEQELSVRIKELRKEGKTTITEADFRAILEDLKDIFPVISGPLSAGLADGVFISDVSTKVPDGVYLTAPRVDTEVVMDGAKVTRRVNTIVRTLVSAVNSGAVLPVQAIDGAQIAYLIDSVMKDGGIADRFGMDRTQANVLTIHDAETGPVHLTDELAFAFNRGSFEIHEQYDLLKEVLALGARLEDYVEEHPAIWGGSPSVTLNSVREIMADSDDPDYEPKFKESFEYSLKRLRGINIELGRRRDEKKRYSEGTLVSPMVGFRGSMVRIGKDGMPESTPDTKYLWDLRAKGVYRTASNDTATDAGTREDISTHVLTSSRSAKSKRMASYADKLADPTTVFTSDDTIAIVIPGKSTKVDKTVLATSEIALMAGSTLVFDASVTSTDTKSSEKAVFDALMEQDGSTLRLSQVRRGDNIEIRHEVVQADTGVNDIIAAQVSVLDKIQSILSKECTP